MVESTGLNDAMRPDRLRNRDSGAGRVWTAVMSARDDVKLALQRNVRFVAEAIGNAELEPLARAWIARDRSTAWNALCDEIDEYAEHCIDQVLEENPRMDPLDALNKLEDAYRDKSAAPQGFGMAAYANNLLAGMAKVQS